MKMRKSSESFSISIRPESGVCSADQVDNNNVGDDDNSFNNSGDILKKISVPVVKRQSFENEDEEDEEDDTSQGMYSLGFHSKNIFIQLQIAKTISQQKKQLNRLLLLL